MGEKQPCFLEIKSLCKYNTATFFGGNIREEAESLYVEESFLSRMMKYYIY